MRSCGEPVEGCESGESSIFGLGAQDFDLNDPEFDAHSKEPSSVSAPTPVRPPRAPCEPAYHGGLDVLLESVARALREGCVWVSGR